MTRSDGREGQSVVVDGEVRKVLAVAVQHHQSGDLDRARGLYEQVLATHPMHADALQYYGILCDQCGDTPRAETLIRRAISVRDDVAPYHDNLGTVLEHSGQLDAALRAYEEAERLEPGVAERAYNIGLVLERMGESAQAEACYRAALEQHPRDVDCRFALANLLSGQADLQAAIQAYRQLLSIDAGHVAARISLGNALQDSGQIDLALGEYRLAIARAPDNPRAHHNQGRALLHIERLAEAQQAFEAVLRLDSQFIEARLGLALALERQGLLGRAYAAFRAVCASASASANETSLAQARAGLLRVARVLPPSRHDELLVQIVLARIDAGEASPTSYARLLGEQLVAKLELQEGACGADSQALDRAIELTGEPLFEVLMQRCVNVVPALEHWLCTVRRALLLADAERLRGCEALLRALALQCAANEYVFALSDDEVGVIDAVRAQLESQTSQDLLATGDSVCDLLLCACYGSLAELSSVRALTADAALDNPWLAPILQRTVLEPLREQAIAADIEALAAIEDAGSQLVREQYEENPYPRWREMEPQSVVSHGGDGAARLLAETADASILVAGCGTGYEPLMLARRYPGCSVVAIDLSRASLAYAQRMADELKVDSISFRHGDLLDAQHLRRKFQLITASGVLHHMADPLAGWRALAQCLDERGLMKVALYSRHARAAINAARERVAALGLPANAQGVRTLRARVLAGDEPALESLLDSDDFYTTSMCRDLLFHALEHQFDLGEIAVMLEALGLEFTGFELPHPLVRRQFLAAQFGEETDLAAWARFEESHPQTFEGMYVMWLRKSTAVSRSASD